MLGLIGGKGARIGDARARTSSVAGIEEVREEGDTKSVEIGIIASDWFLARED